MFKYLKWYKFYCLVIDVLFCVSGLLRGFWKLIFNELGY